MARKEEIKQPIEPSYYKGEVELPAQSDQPIVSEQRQKTVSELSLIELKAFAYDLLNEQEQVNNKLSIINAELTKRLG